MFSVPCGSESPLALSHLSRSGSLCDFKSGRLKMHQWRPVGSTLSVAANLGPLCVNVPCKRLLCYFQAPKISLCLSGADWTHKLHSSTSCVTVSRGPSTSHFLALNKLCLQAMTQFIGPIRDCLTSCLHTLLYFPLGVQAHSLLPLFHPPFWPTYMSMHVHIKQKYQTC